jgi:hypothetical protein
LWFKLKFQCPVERGQVRLECCSRKSDLNVARARGLVDREKDVELEHDGDGEEDGVDDETNDSEGSGNKIFCDMDVTIFVNLCFLANKLAFLTQIAPIYAEKGDKNIVF